MTDDELDRVLRALPVHDHALDSARFEARLRAAPQFSLIERYEPALVSLLAAGQLIWLAARLL